MLIGKTKGDCRAWSQEETYGETLTQLTLTQLITATLKKKTWMKKHRPQAAA